MFFTLVLSAMLLMSAYVGWRSGSVPRLSRWMPWPARTAILAALGVSYVAARTAEGAGYPLAARVLEVVGAYWIGVLLLLFVALLAADLSTGFGLFFKRRAGSIRGAGMLVGIVLSVIALIQAARPPVVREYDVQMAGLPASSNGTSIVFVSDLHLGTMLGERWLAARVAQIAALRPDAIVLGGDVLEGDSPSERDLLPLLGRLRAPLGVWAVAGNHEHHGGGSTMAALEGLGVRTLMNEWKALAPGVVIAGVDGARERREDNADRDAGATTAATVAREDNLATALRGRPAAAATILVSHAPTRVEEAARSGVGLMLSGHTHDGQIWPFRYVVRTQFAYLAGRYDVAGMPLIVCRGTGTFGPRMRLWYPSEILRIRLRTTDGAGAGIARVGVAD